MEELLQVILQWGPRQQQLMIYLIAIEDPEKLESEAGTGRRKLSVASDCLTSQTFPYCQLLNSLWIRDTHISSFFEHSPVPR